ncbi:DUF1015 domain-containing protein [Thiohalophilus thiocyanatoxydans]|uniref:Uncharacterized protein (DUF1015 family) n=1 Tax=Thiohalophilus thiocyanatoxydans TaxID=381308 RepID=A0A4R8IMZ7_9GAMM|nr:DUF1015 family protein [Thiohalophilus thiocyanatoxydans]TDY01554.1 uncharacterized protein (DUF1015 family) [Thiohalophilus thiocyanatoxydans]
MSLIRPFSGLRPAPEHADDVIAPPYDVLNSQEARDKVQGRPYSFLHISKPEIDLPEDTDPYSDSVYAKGAENLQNLIDNDILMREAQPSYYFYQLQMGEHIQIGLVAVASVAEYDRNRIRKHEYTRPDKETDRVKQIDALNAQTGPVFLTYRHNATIDDLVETIRQTPPLYDLIADDGVRHVLWRVDDPADIETITSTFEAMDCLYIADGHHRSAAASRVAEMRAATGKTNGEASHDYFLSVIFPDDQMMILDYNRVIRDLNGLDQAAFLDKLEEAFRIEPSSESVKPGQSGEFGMYLGGQWYRLAIEPGRIPKADPVGRLDVSLLQNNLIDPVLGINDPRRDKRIDFVGGIRGLAELERRVDSGEMAVAFALYPTSLSDLMAVADANEVMPPKSTWFEPKLADGLVSHVLD